MAVEKTVKINVDTSNAVKGVGDLNKSLKDTSKETKNIGESSKELTGKLDGLTGGAITKFKAFTGTLGSVATGFKGVGAAIAASGLGILLITLGALKAAFTGSEEGQNKFAKIMGVVGALTGNLVDLLADLGDKIISVFENPKAAMKSFADFLKSQVTNRVQGLLELFPALRKAAKQLFNGDFSAAAETAANATAKVALGVEDLTGKINGATAALKEFGKEQLREGKLAADVADKRAKADILARELLVDRANLENKIAQLRLKSREEERFSAKERKDAIVEAQGLEDVLLQKEKEVLQLRSDAISLENTFSRSNKENLDAEAEAIAQVARQEAARTNAQRATQRELNRVNKEIAADAKAEAKEKKDAADKLIAEENKRLKSISDLKDKFLKADVDNDAKSREEKLALERSRAQEDLNLLIGTETEKREAQLALNELYNQKEKELKETLDKEQSKKDAEESEKKLTKQLEEADNELLKFSEKKDLLDAQRASILSDENITEEQRTKLLADNSKARDEIDKKRAKAQQDAANAAKSALSTAADLLGKNTAAGKAAAIAATTIDTIQSGVSAYKGMVAAIPGPIGIAAGAVAAAGSLASGYASVKKILSVKTPGGGGGGASAPSGGATAPSAPAFNLVGQSGVNQVQESVQEEATPIQAYVVGAQVTNQQELDRNQQDSASIG